MKKFMPVWRRILKHEGATFHTIENRPFSYQIEGRVLRPSRGNWNIPRGDVQKAYGMLPIQGPGKINQIVQGASYVWGILNDPRIVGHKTAISNPLGKYVPLKRFLQSAHKSQKSMTLSFEQIEVVLRDTLPLSARKQRQWWANDTSHVQARAWLEAGFEVAPRGVDFKKTTVCFKKSR